MTWDQLPGRMRSGSCELCSEDRMTEWFYEDDDCWVAECESCSVPMVVWRNHHNAPSDETKALLHARLDLVVAEHFDAEHYIDDNLRSIPDHYHAHARPRRGFFSGGLRRRTG